jgi:hypothetical protein
MVRRRISEAQRWQIIGMHTTGMSFKAIGRQMGYHYTVVSQTWSSMSVCQQWTFNDSPWLKSHWFLTISNCSCWQTSNQRLQCPVVAIGCQMGYNYTVVSWLVRKHTQTKNVKDLPRSGRPRVTSDRDDRALQPLVRRVNKNKFRKTPDLNTLIRTVNILNFE